MTTYESRRGGGRSRNSSSNNNTNNGRQADLSGLLTQDEKAELLKLVRSITGRMHHRINRVFKEVEEIKPATTHFHFTHTGFWEIIPVSAILAATTSEESVKKTKNKENEPSTLPSDNILHSAHTSTELRAEEALHREEAEALIPGRLGELRKEVLAFFRKWSQAVIKRLDEIIPKTSNMGPKVVPLSSVPSARYQAIKKAGMISASLLYFIRLCLHRKLRSFATNFYLLFRL